ncbi:hypothetical protein [Flavobacterium aquicola]|uniref:Heme-binding HmuY-like protein n=1 Tax=Flavobacterium aquicola TaxID=1682742 RepID=A0A3E0EMQ0_9FLAO|nr:hypothetical protein [Flavobacterium aquicola]REG99020.1 hypothetical protein C8P67_105185 [Flavobacterium aquicola]
MKNKIYIIALLLISCLISSCESDDEDKSDFQNSVLALSDFKQSTNNSYKYIVTGASWIGIAWETTIIIVDGKATERHFKYTITQGFGNNIPQGELEWIEKGSEIGSHTNGEPALTLDEIYKKAEQEWLIKRDNVKIHFETKNNGLISICGYEADDCQDDCFVGVNIKSIESLQ